MTLPLRVEQAVADLQASVLTAADEFHKTLLDEAHQDKTTIMCSPECNHCCRFPVLISVLEALPLYRSLLGRGHWRRIRPAVEGHARATLGLALGIWQLSLIACPLLNSNGLCLGHSVRPLSCRVTFSIGDPRACHPHRAANNPNLVPKATLMAGFDALETKLFKKLDALYIRMPISKSLLLAEALCEGKLDFEGMRAWLIKEFKENT